MLIATRALLGLAGATIAPSTLSLLRNMFHDPRQRTMAVGVWITSYSVGGAIGPLVGGVLLQHFWWGSVFLIAVPVMVLLLVLAPILLPEFRDPAAGRLDLPSAGLSLVSVLAVIYGLTFLPLMIMRDAGLVEAHARGLGIPAAHVTWIKLGDVGIHGNGHMMMLEKNNLQVADVIARWLGKSVARRSRGASCGRRGRCRGPRASLWAPC